MSSILAVAWSARAGDLSLPVTGNLLGSVNNGLGAPQSGASIKLFNKYNRLIAKTLSTSDGKFAFADLSPDFYSLRVSLESYIPAFRDKIAVKAGSNSMLQINMATLFSSIQLTSTVPIGAMTNDWKWALRAAPETRPITRLLPDDPDLKPQVQTALFSDTHMQVGISSGGASLLDSNTAVADVGTDFALSTNLFGKDALQVAGRIGQSYDSVGGPQSVSLCAIYTPHTSYGLANPPEIAVTATQIRMITPQSQGTAGSDEDSLRAMSVNVYETVDMFDSFHVEYGASGESIEYIQHATRVSPFARVSTDIGKLGTLVLSYNDGGRPDELTQHAPSQNSGPAEILDPDLNLSVNALTRLPQASLNNGRLELQRTQNMEAGFSKTAGSRTYSFSTFYERVSNGRLDVAGNLSSLNPGSLLSDGMSTMSVYNIGNYNRNGYLASIDQRLGDRTAMQLAYGRIGGFTASDDLQPGINSKDDFLTSRNHNVASIGMHTKVLRSGTRFSAHYGWADERASIPTHSFTTQNAALLTGLNIAVRQPLPNFFGFGGRIELAADLQNMLAEGYLPLHDSNGNRLLIVQAPRTVSGGLNITF